jgi:hypothetical protein
MVSALGPVKVLRTGEPDFQPETSGIADHDHDLIHDLNKRLDAVWRYDQYIANADGKPQLQKFWRDCKRQDIDNIKQIKEFVAQEIENNCF